MSDEEKQENKNTDGDSNNCHQQDNNDNKQQSSGDQQDQESKGNDQADGDQKDQESGENNQSSQDQNGSGDSGDQSNGEQSKDGDKQLSDAEASLTKQDPPPTILEWSVRIGSALILLGLTIYLIASGLLPTKPPQFDVAFDVEKSLQREGRWVQPVEVINVGTLAVEDLQLTLALVGSDGDVVEKISSSIPLIGQNELFNLEFWLDQDPREYELEIKVNSYKVP